MKIPKKVKVGGIDYAVLMAPIDGIKHRNTPMADAMGIADPDARIIILEKDRTDKYEYKKVICFNQEKI